MILSPAHKSQTAIKKKKKPRFKSQTAGAVVFLANQLKQWFIEQSHLAA
jgi:hypothetical protein